MRHFRDFIVQIVIVLDSNVVPTRALDELAPNLGFATRHEPARD